MRKSWQVLAVLAVLSLGWGCAALAPAPSGPLTASVQPRVFDLPVPNGFSIDAERSYYSQVGDTRAGRLLYRGRSDTESLITFFRDSMPISGWTLVRESSDFGSYILDFEKGVEGAEVRIKEGSFRSEVAISVHRLSR